MPRRYFKQKHPWGRCNVFALAPQYIRFSVEPTASAVLMDRFDCITVFPSDQRGQGWQGGVWRGKGQEVR